MAENDRISSLTLCAQERMFRLALRNHGLSLKVISLESGIPYNTVRSWAGHNGAQAMMPVSAVNKLAICMPDYLLSLLFEASDRQLVEATDDDGDHDSMNADCIDFTAAHARARHPNSPEGVNIAPCEDKDLRTRRAKLLRRVA